MGGRLRDEVKSDIMSVCAHLSTSRSLIDVLEVLLPLNTKSSRLERAGELILWADKYGRKRDMKPIPGYAWPSLNGACPLLSKQLATHKKRSYPRQSSTFAQRIRALRQRKGWYWDY